MFDGVPARAQQAQRAGREARLHAQSVRLPLMMEAREFNACAAKNAVGLSMAVLTFLPVESLFWVLSSNCAVPCSVVRLLRIPAVKLMSLIAMVFILF